VHTEKNFFLCLFDYYVNFHKKPFLFAGYGKSCPVIAITVPPEIGPLEG
jgi:hypothetical protein